MRPIQFKFQIALSLLCLAVVAGCNDSDVTPANNSNFILAEDKTPDITAGGAIVRDDDKVTEDDFLPEEYRRSGGEGAANMAIATIQPTAGNTASGMVAFIQANADDTQLRVVGKIIHIPAGIHGFHIHEIGNCTAADGSSAGDHFNPTSTLHGDREATVRHIGDMGNIIASGEEVANIDFYDRMATFEGVNSIVGKAFIIHANPDDLLTQPSGNAGDRIACGVIENKQAQSVLAPQ